MINSISFTQCVNPFLPINWDDCKIVSKDISKCSFEFTLLNVWFQVKFLWLFLEHVEKFLIVTLKKVSNSKFSLYRRENNSYLVCKIKINFFLYKFGIKSQYYLVLDRLWILREHLFDLLRLVSPLSYYLS